MMSQCSFGVKGLGGFVGRAGRGKGADLRFVHQFVSEALDEPLPL